MTDEPITGSTSQLLAESGMRLEQAYAEIKQLRGHKEEADRHIKTIAELRHEIERLRRGLEPNE